VNPFSEKSRKPSKSVFFLQVSAVTLTNGDTILLGSSAPFSGSPPSVWRIRWRQWFQDPEPQREDVFQVSFKLVFKFKVLKLKCLLL